MRTISLPRVARCLVLLAWAGFFDWLWLSDEWRRYVGPRTAWVVPFGAIALTLAALGYLSTVRARSAPDRLGLRELGALTVMVAPVLLVFAVPSPSLGAFAVQRKQGTKAAFEAAARKAVHRTPPPADAPLDPAFIMTLTWAAQNPKRAEALLGTPLNLVAFVSREPDASGGTEMDITRFITACCAADAVPASVEVAPDETLKRLPSLSNDTWVQVKGIVAIVPSRKYGALASSVETVDEPSDPYLPPY
jgi:uncharacterized repeat protein (TIGR03943 family)